MKNEIQQSNIFDVFSIRSDIEPYLPQIFIHKWKIQFSLFPFFITHNEEKPQ